MRISDAWRASTPEPLQKAIEHIRKTFDERLFLVTSHGREAIPAAPQSAPEPVVFNRYFDSLKKSICDLVGTTFSLVLEIARENRIEEPINWAKSQLSMMLEDELLLSEAMRIRDWIVIACDGDYAPPPKPELGRATEEAWLFHRDWQSPAWLCMKPLGNLSYISQVAWERKSVERSQGALEYHSNICSIRIESYLKQLAGQAHIQRALGGAEAEPNRCTRN